MKKAKTAKALPPPPPIPEIYSLQETADAFRMSYNWVRDEVTSGQIHGIKLGRRWFVTGDEIRRVIQIGSQMGAVESGRQPDPV